ncbi:Dabb family protein [Amycolatopsis lurida]
MKIKHIVLFTLKEGISTDDDRVQEAADFSASHARHIPDIQTWETGFDTSRRAISADFAIVGTFADAEAVARYLDHPHHRTGVAKWREIAHWTVVDLTV